MCVVKTRTLAICIFTTLLWGVFSHDKAKCYATHIYVGTCYFVCFCNTPHLSITVGVKQSFANAE